MSTTVNEFIRSLSKLRPIDKDKQVTINGQPIQSISVKEIKTETRIPVRDNNGEQVYKTDDKDKFVLNAEGGKIPVEDVIVDLNYKVQFNTGKQHEDYKTVNKLIEALTTLSLKERLGFVYCDGDDIFVVGTDYSYADRINIDTDSTITE